MKRNVRRFAMAAVMSSCLLFASCVGSFRLFNKLADWNQGVTGSKFVNELIFLGLNIIPAYPVCMLADVLVLNTIEFWSGSNPVASVGKTEKIKGQNGTYIVEHVQNGYNITKEGSEQSAELLFDENNQTWSVTANDQTYPLLKMNGDNTAEFYMANGQTKHITLDKKGTNEVITSIVNNEMYAIQ